MGGEDCTQRPGARREAALQALVSYDVPGQDKEMLELTRSAGGTRPRTITMALCRRKYELVIMLDKRMFWQRKLQDVTSNEKPCGNRIEAGESLGFEEELCHSIAAWRMQWRSRTAWCPRHRQGATGRAGLGLDGDYPTLAVLAACSPGCKALQK
jgi:hypothetical protein